MACSDKTSTSEMLLLVRSTSPELQTAQDWTRLGHAKRSSPFRLSAASSLLEKLEEGSSGVPCALTGASARKKTLLLYILPSRHEPYDRIHIYIYMYMHACIHTYIHVIYIYIYAQTQACLCIYLPTICDEYTQVYDSRYKHVTPFPELRTPEEVGTPGAPRLRV